MNKLNASVLPLVGLSVVLSLAAIIAVAARWPDNNTASVATQAAVVSRPAPLQTVHVVMHDPGCHWFQTASGLKRTLHVTGSGAKLYNTDEAAIKVVGPSGVQLDKVGQTIRLARGSYHITMVGQASDDNHLSLTVS